MDIINLVAHELTEHALEIHRKAVSNEQPVPIADMSKLAKVMLALTLQPVCEDQRVQNSVAVYNFGSERSGERHASEQFLRGNDPLGFERSYPEDFPECRAWLVM